jgi:hypothetical protein
LCAEAGSGQDHSHSSRDAAPASGSTARTRSTPYWPSVAKSTTRSALSISRSQVGEAKKLIAAS